MALTKKASFNFDPLIALQHISAYFRRKLVWGQFAWRISKDFRSQVGETVTIPYFNKLTDAEEPGEDDTVDVDNLGDNKFTATVKETAKAFGITDAARIRMGVTDDKWENEGFAQVGRVMAEKVDKDLVGVLSTAANRTVGRTQATSFTISSAFGSDKGYDQSSIVSERANVRSIRKYLNSVFGDKADEVMALVIHSAHETDMITDATAGLLKADAISPFSGMKGFQGVLFGKYALVINDNVPEGSDVTITDSASMTQKYKSFNIVAMKADPYGLMVKKDTGNMEAARNMLQRRDIYMATKWYATTGLHKKISTDDERVTLIEHISNVQTT